MHACLPSQRDPGQSLLASRLSVQQIALHKEALLMILQAAGLLSKLYPAQVEQLEQNQCCVLTPEF